MKHTHIHYILYALLPLLALAGCSENEAPGTFEPQLEVLPATGVERTCADLHGIVTLKGNTQMPAITFHYGKTRFLEQKVTAQALSSGDTLTVSLSHLTPGTTYYWCMTADNGQVKLTTDTLRFTTVPNDPPRMKPLTILSAGPTSVIVGFEIQDNGGERITHAGCCIREKQGTDTRKTEASPLKEDGQMQIRFGQLQPNSTYELWAYAANSIGEVCTDTISLSTSSTFVLSEPGQLAKLMQGEVCEASELAFQGPLNSDDLRCLRAMMGRDEQGNETGGQLARADLTEVTIVEGGSTYDETHFAQDNVIGAGMFARLNCLERIQLPATATRIEENAFEGCTGLKSLLIPASVKRIGQSRGCTALEDISTDAANQYFCSRDGVLLDADATQVIWFPMGKSGDYVLPSTVTSIGDYAFRQCNISHFTLPATLQEIGQGAFSHSQVEEVELPESLQSLPTGTFQGCKRLKTVHLGSALELVSDYTFDGCPLEHLYISATLPPYCNSKAFASNSTPFTPTCILHVPKGCKVSYRSSQGWKQFVYVKEMP